MGPRGVKRPADLYEAVAVVDLEDMQIFVMTMMGRKITMDVKADGSDKIDNIKEKIESKEEIPVTKQTLGFEEDTRQHLELVILRHPEGSNLSVVGEGR